MTKSLNFWIAMTFSIPFFSCSNSFGKRVLAVGGTHVLEIVDSCKITKTHPANAVKNLNWEGQFAFEALSTGYIEVLCGAERWKLDFVKAEKIEIERLNDEVSIDIPIKQLLKVRVQLYDSSGRILEVGKYTSFNWYSTSNFEIANDRSSGEFGFCDTCFGNQTFRAVQQGKGMIEVRFGNLLGSLQVNVAE
jgi:hypothetical protein